VARVSLSGLRVRLLVPVLLAVVPAVALFLHAGAGRGVARNLVVLAIIVGTALVAAWVGAEFLVLGRVRRLLEAARLGEREQLGHAFDEMVATLERREAELRDTEARYRTLVGQIPAVVYTVSLEAGRTLFVSPQIEASLGFTPAQWVADSESWQRQLHPDDRERVLAERRRSLESGEPFYAEYRMLSRAGAARWCRDQATVVRDETGRPLFLQGVRLDISARRRAEEALRDQQERSRLIVDTATDAFVGMDTGGHITDWNRQAEAIFGWTREEVMGRRVSETIMPAHYREAHERGLRHFLATGEGPVLHRRLELTALHRDGHEFPVELTVWPLRTGETWSFNAFVYDASERKRAEQALAAYATRLQQSNRDLEEFASIAAHDLREPLRKIISFGDLLAVRAAGTLCQEERNYLARMQSAAARMGTLVESLLELSRVSTRPRAVEPIDLSAVVAQVVVDLEARIRESGGRVIVGTLPTLPADPAPMRQLFQNLVSNALKFHRLDAPPLVTVDGRRGDGATWEITVTDTGIGFDEKYLDRIFKPFERLHGRDRFEGSGMGLAICRKIVERHGGTIAARSEPGRGSAFTVRLPAEVAEETA
jgi:PAS domain S-box-containing protein